MSDAEDTWHHVTADDESQRHLPNADAEYYSLPRQVSRHDTAGDDPRTARRSKASTLPRRRERSRSDVQPKLAKTETETGSEAAGGKSRTGKPGKSSVGDLQLLETVMKIDTAFETETIPRDVTDDVMRGKKEGSRSEDRGSVGPVFRRARPSRPSVVAGRRSYNSYLYIHIRI